MGEYLLLMLKAKVTIPDTQFLKTDENNQQLYRKMSRRSEQRVHLKGNVIGPSILLMRNEILLMRNENLNYTEIPNSN